MKEDQHVNVMLRGRSRNRLQVKEDPCRKLYEQSLLQEVQLIGLKELLIVPTNKFTTAKFSTAVHRDGDTYSARVRSAF